MKVFVAAFLLVGAVFLAYKSFRPQLTLYGEWRLNVEAMAEQLTKQGIDQALIREFKNSNGDGQTKLLITKDAVTVTLMGKNHEFAYEIASVHENCTEMRVKESGNVLRNCVEGKTLKVYNRKDSTVEIYDRFSSP